MFHVTMAHVAIGFLVLEGAGLLLDALPLPEWSYHLVVTVALAGSPVVLVLAWMYDRTFSGIQRREPAWFRGSPVLRWLLPAVELVVSLAVAVLLGW